MSNTSLSLNHIFNPFSQTVTLLLFNRFVIVVFFKCCCVPSIFFYLRMKLFSNILNNNFLGKIISNRSNITKF